MKSARKLAKAIFPESFSDYWFEQQAVFAKFSNAGTILEELNAIIVHYNAQPANQAPDKNILSIKQKDLDDRQALKVLARKLKIFYHPDKNNLSKEQAEEQTKKINQIFAVLEESGQMAVEENLKVNSSALRITSAVIQVSVTNLLYLVPLTLVIFHRKDYGIRKLYWVACGIALASALVLSIISQILISFIKQPDFKKEPSNNQENLNNPDSFTTAEFNEIKYNLLLQKTKGIAQPHVQFITNIVVTFIFCATLVALGKANILTPSASYKATGFAGGLFVLGLVFIAIVQNCMVKQSTEQLKAFGIIESQLTDDFLEREGNTQDLSDLHCKYSAELHTSKPFEFMKLLICIVNFIKENSTLNTMVATAKVNSLFKEPKMEPALQPLVLQA